MIICMWPNTDDCMVQDMRDAVVATYEARKNLALTLKDTRTVVGKLETILTVVLHGICFLFYLSIFNVRPSATQPTPSPPPFPSCCSLPSLLTLIPCSGTCTCVLWGLMRVVQGGDCKYVVCIACSRIFDCPLVWLRKYIVVVVSL